VCTTWKPASVSASTWRCEMAQCRQALHVVQKYRIDEIYANLNGALGVDDVEFLSAKQIRLTGELFSSGVRVYRYQ